MGDNTAVNMRGMSCPRSGPTMPVSVMQNTLKKYGVPPSPMEKFALTAYAATRDVSMRAQAREEFLKLDQVTQDKLRKLNKEVAVRAASIDPEDLAGVTEPLGFWDPAGFSENGNVAAYRRAELKHGRVCMQASLGIIVSEKFHPIFDAWGEGPYVSAVATHFTETAAKNFWPAFWIMAAGHELATSLADYDGKELGDFGFYPLGLRPEDPEELKVLENKELNNGRLAMVSAAGMITGVGDGQEHLLMAIRISFCTSSTFRMCLIGIQRWWLLISHHSFFVAFLSVCTPSCNAVRPRRGVGKPAHR